MDVRLATLYQYIDGEICEQDFLELDFADDQETIVGARKLVEQTKKTEAGGDCLEKSSLVWNLQNFIDRILNNLLKWQSHFKRMR